MTSSTRAPKASSTLRNGPQAPLPLSKIATDSEIQMYLQLWTSKKYWQPPGFIFAGVPAPGYIHVLLGRLGNPEQCDPPLLRKEQWDKLLVLNSLVILFQAMLSKQDYYHSSTTKFYEMVDADLKCGVARCQRFTEMYVGGRRTYLAWAHHSARLGSTITDLVDQWISFLDIIASRQPKTPELIRNSAAQSLSRLASSQPPPKETKQTKPSGATSNPRKRKGSNLEHHQVKRTHTSFETNRQNVLDDASRAPSIARSGAREGGSLFVGDNLDTVEASEAAVRNKSNYSVQSSVKTTTRKPKVGANDSDSIGAALKKLSRLVKRRHERYETRHSTIERKAADTMATVADIQKSNANTVGQLSEDLAEQRRVQRLLQTSVASIEAHLQGNGDIFQCLVEKIKTTVKDQVRVTWQGAALYIAHRRRDMDKKLEEQDCQLGDLRTRMEMQENGGTSQKKVRKTAQKMEEILDRHHLNQQREMERLRATVAAQASTIEEQGKHIVEMRQQIRKLSEEQDTALSKGRTGLWSKRSDGQYGEDNGLLWSPQS